MAEILVIDDDPLVRKWLRDTLARAGHNVHEASDGRQGEAAAAARGFDLVITDLIMPEQEGIETIRRLRQSHPRVKILAISGGGRTRFTDFLAVARKFGADDAIAKPFDRTYLLGALERLLAT